MLDHTIVHGVFVGPARSGKNSLMERLLGRMPSSVSPSTGVAESVVQVKVIQKSTRALSSTKPSARCMALAICFNSCMQKGGS